MVAAGGGDDGGCAFNIRTKISANVPVVVVAAAAVVLPLCIPVLLLLHASSRSDLYDAENPDRLQTYNNHARFVTKMRSVRIDRTI